ncbi:MAG: hypothetical protein U9R28_03775 [Pseudomonadota bacterium]|nr:hypothetical protein [Pseudomonadota bacterium]
MPVMLAVILLTVEVVAYAMNSFAANDVLTDVHSAIIEEVELVSNLPSGGTLDPSVQYASCNAGSVVLPTGSNATITSIVTSTLAAKNINFSASDPANTNITMNQVSGFDVYVINFSGTANTLVIPTFLSELMPINVDTVVSIKDACTP